MKARYSDGVLTPLEPLDLEDGSEVTESIDDGSRPRRGLAGIVVSVKRLHEATLADAWDDLPADLAMNKKHYLYGHPGQVSYTHRGPRLQP